MDVNELERKINRISTASFNLQTQAIATLVGEIHSYVERIQEEEEVVEGMSTLRNKIRDFEKTRTDAADENEINKAKAESEKAKAAYNDAVRIKRHLGMKKSELRNLKNKLDQIRTEINRVIN